jgi:serine/threonine-protein kinase HipA
LNEHDIDFHESCSRKIFGTEKVPELNYDESQMAELALQIIKSQHTVTGVQPKLSLHLPGTFHKSEPKRFTIVGLWGNYILKPPTSSYPEMPEVEDLSMHLAEIVQIQVVPHTLIRLKSGELAYLTQRIDRVGPDKRHMEDFCQLTERQTEHKYQASYEHVGKTIRTFSAYPGLDVVNYCEVVLFSFLIGNADMHLKNFSLLYDPNNGPILAPAYDLLSTALVNPSDDEDLALTLNGKKKRLHRSDFETAFSTMKLDAKQQENLFQKMKNAKEPWLDFIQNSFLSTTFKENLTQIIQERFDRIY